MKARVWCETKCGRRAWSGDLWHGGWIMAWPVGSGSSTRFAKCLKGLRFQQSAKELMGFTPTLSVGKRQSVPS